MKLKRILATLLALGVTTGAGVMVRADTAAAYTSVPAITYNMCGDRCHRPGTASLRPGNPVDEIMDRVNARTATPWTISLQEECWGHMWDLGSRLQSRNMRSILYPRPSGAVTTDCRDNGFGTGVVQLNPILNTNLEYALGNGKYMNCAQSQGYGFVWAGCTVHLSTDVGLAQNEAYAAALARSDLESKGINVMLGGDFNMYPNQVTSWDMTWDIDSADIGSTVSRTFGMDPYTPTIDRSLERKIDYFFVRPAFLPGPKSAAPRCDRPDRSDHCELDGTFSG